MKVALLLAPFFARSLTLVPRSLLLHRTETLATKATQHVSCATNIQLENPKTNFAISVFSARRYI